MITYVIINMTEVPLVDFNQVLQTSEATLRVSCNGLQTVLKWEGSEPSFVHTLPSYDSTSYGPYTHSGILAIMATAAWTDPNPME